MKRFLSIALLVVLSTLSQSWASDPTEDSELRSANANIESKTNKALELKENFNTKIHPLQVHEAFPLLSLIHISEPTDQRGSRMPSSA